MSASIKSLRIFSRGKLAQVSKQNSFSLSAYSRNNMSQITEFIFDSWPIGTYRNIQISLTQIERFIKK